MQKGSHIVLNDASWGGRPLLFLSCNNRTYHVSYLFWRLRRTHGNYLSHICPDIPLLFPAGQRRARHGAVSSSRAEGPFLLFDLFHTRTTDFVLAQPRDERPDAIACAPDPLREVATAAPRARALVHQVGHELAQAVLDLLRPCGKSTSSSLSFSHFDWPSKLGLSPVHTMSYWQDLGGVFW